MNITVVIGVRPHYVKACGLQKILEDTDIDITFLDVHQHYDKYLHDIYLNNSNIRIETVSNIQPPEGTPLDDFVRQISDVGMWFSSLEGRKSKALLVFGDANPAFASSVAANRLGVPIIHLEAGVRRIATEKEHWNTLVTDHLSSLRFCYTQKNMYSLSNEGLLKDSYLVGDVLAEWAIERAKKSPNTFYGRNYCLVSIHRPQNCNDEAINCLCTSLKNIKKEIIWIMHPRMTAFESKIKSLPSVTVLPSQSHDEVLGLLKNASLIVTDSGGFIREGVLLERNVVVCHEQGIWEDLVSNNAIVRADMTKESIEKAFDMCLSKKLNSGKDFFMIKNGVSIFKKTLDSFLNSI